MLKAAGRLASKPTGPGFTGARIGRGGAAGLQAVRKAGRLPRARMRRVVVKVHIARARTRGAARAGIKAGAGAGAGARGGAGVRAFSRHLAYIQRDGVERYGTGGELYGRDGETIDGRAFAERSREDRHQFRIIVSPEDAQEIADLKATTRSLMMDMERDLGTRLDWVAVDHHNTGHPHTHIVIRGKDALGQDLVIARDYLMKGLRARAEEGLTQELGPRRDIEIARARYREVSLDRFTGIDHALERRAVEGRIELGAVSGPVSGAVARFERSLQRQRLAHLKGLHLAEQQGPDVWRLKPGWDRALKAMGCKGDIIRMLAAGITPGKDGPDVSRLRFFDERPDDAGPLTGTLIGHGPEDELTDRRFVLVEDFDGMPWHVPAGDERDAGMPPRGAVLEIARRRAAPMRADHVIADIAERSGGYYSDALHAAADPSASSAYRLAHKRRLEALRRAGIVERDSSGVWRVGDDYLDRAAGFEAGRGTSVALRVRSWMALEAQIEARADTWLDGDAVQGAGGGDNRLAQARAMRLAFLRRVGLLPEGEEVLSDVVRQRLRGEELRRAAQAESGRSGRAFQAMAAGDRFEGKVERWIDLARGRMAVIGNAKAFALIPWRADLERQRGRSLVVEAHKRGVSWTLDGGRGRGISR
uniref:Conjugal transfer protein TraI n=1 Tax=Aquisalinus luteolus TaxID=1566827 RepID=A0A8J3A284_9PROT|nr:conjugal transfer protein TraI [Aquisalinus luteolus]